MKIKFSVIAAAVVLFAATSAGAETTYTRDFNFGLSNNYNNVKAVSKDNKDDWRDTLERFNQIRSELPDEVPVFKPYDVSGKYEIYVSPSGYDGNPGTKEEPVKTFDAAIRRAEGIRDKSEGVVIYAREGIYSIGDGIKIPATISGTEEHPTFISAYPGEKVSLAGGIEVYGKDFKIADDENAMRKLPEKAKGKVYSIDLKKYGYTTYPTLTKTDIPKLTVDGAEYTLARWPNFSEVKYGKYEGREDGVIDPGEVTRGPDGNDSGTGFEFVILDPHPFNWENTGNIWVHGAFDFEWYLVNHRIKSFNKDTNSIRTSTSTYWGARYDSINKYYYLNVLEELDIPGEWFLDDKTGILYIYPATDISNAEIAISSGKSVGISVEQGAKHIVLNDLNVGNLLGTGIEMSGYRNVIQNCTVKNAAEPYVRLKNATNSGLINSQIYGGVTMSGDMSSQSPVSSMHTLSPSRNFIQNNLITGSRIYLSGGLGNIVSHNTIINSEGAAIYYNQKEVIIEYNEIVGSPSRVYDMGTIYSEGGTAENNNHVRYNFIHDTTLRENNSIGIYFDDLTSNSFAYGNILQHANIYMHGGFYNVAYNNVIIDNRKSNSVGNSQNYYVGNMDASLAEGYFSKTSIGRVWSEFNKEYTRDRYPVTTNIAEISRQIRYKRFINEGNYTRDAYEYEWLAPKGCVYIKNVLCDAKVQQKLAPGEIRSLWDNNYETDDKSIFEDYSNRNYNIKKDSPVYSEIEGFETLPAQEKTGIQTPAKKINISKISTFYPANTLETGISVDDVSFKWQAVPEATYYTVEISKDKDFNEKFVDYNTIDNYYTLNEQLDLSATYYWRVTAHCVVQHTDTPTVTTETAAFKTYSYAEMLENAVLNTAEFDLEAKNVEKIAESIREKSDDTTIGVYKEGTKQRITDMVEEARAYIKKCALQSEIIEKTEDMKNKLYEILHDGAIPFTRTYTVDNLSLFRPGKENIAVYSLNGDTLTFGADKEANSSAALMYDPRELTAGETVKAKVNFGDMNNWNAFAIKQVSPQGASTIVSSRGYYIVLKKEVFELQKYPVKGTAIIATAPNEGIIAPNTYHEIETSCTLVDENSMHIVFKVDGKVALEYTDTDNPIKDTGYFSIQAVSGSSPQMSMQAN